MGMNTVEALEQIAEMQFYSRTADIAREALPIAKAEAEELTKLRARVEALWDTGGRSMAAQADKRPPRPTCPNCHHTQAMHDFHDFEEPAAPSCSCVDPFHDPLEQAQVKVAAAQIVAETQAEELAELRRQRDAYDDEAGRHAERRAELEAQLTTQAKELERLRAERFAVARVLDDEEAQLALERKLRMRIGGLTQAVGQMEPGQREFCLAALDEWLDYMMALRERLDALSTETGERG
jgi:hypothetical protein